MAHSLTMSKKERDRLATLERFKAQEISVEDAAAILGVSPRQFYRITKRFTADGDEGLVHRLRGRSSNRGYAPSVKEQVIAIYRERYSDYGPTLFSEMLSEHHQITLSVETLRQSLIEAGLWQKQIRHRRHRRRWPRRPAIGEMEQFAGSTHDWFEGRAPTCAAICLVGESTCRLFTQAH